MNLMKFMTRLFCVPYGVVIQRHKTEKPWESYQGYNPSVFDAFININERFQAENNFWFLVYYRNNKRLYLLTQTELYSGPL